jgi:hypothetical protein
MGVRGTTMPLEDNVGRIVGLAFARDAGAAA